MKNNCTFLVYRTEQIWSSEFGLLTVLEEMMQECKTIEEATESCQDYKEKCAGKDFLIVVET